MTANPLDYTDKVAIVTGGTRGVGRGITQRFLEAGAEVVVCGRTEPEEPIEAGGRSAFFVAADVRKADQIEIVISATRERFGRLDVLVNNAGGAPEVAAAEASPRFHEAIIQLNMIGPLHFAQQANAVMQQQEEGGSIISIASVSGVRPSPGTTAYGGAKAGLISMTTSLAIEWAPKVRVNAITAGLIATELAHLHYGDAEGVARVANTIPLERMGRPEDIGDTCLYLASPLASYVTGCNLLVHGGGEKPVFQAAAAGEDEKA
jgi:NAD(P)-dependent dehydrogenase (short-subunit alcohol dehydrogenase family)